MNNMEKKTAWYNDDILPNEMVSGAIGQKGWVRLEHSEHFKVLDGLVKLVNPKKIADVGCGAAELGRVYIGINYTGFDLPHIIEKVSKVVNKNLKYENFDANDFDYTVFKEYDLLICNGFISELTNPIEVLKKLIENTSGYLIIHRQFFSNETNFSEYMTYGELTTIRSHISLDEFNTLLRNHKIIKQENNPWGDTILIKTK
jgi:hypothetical protein